MAEEMENGEEFNISTYLSGHDTVKSYAQSAFKAIMAATKAANSLPECGSRYEFYRSYHGFCEVMKEEGKIIFSAMSCLAKSQGIKKSFDDLNAEDAFEALVDVNDILLECADLELDDASGSKAKDTQLPEDLVVASVQTPMPINTSWNKDDTPSPQGQTIRLLSAKNIQRPQMRFKEKVDNSNTPFVPLIKYKPNSIKPLAILPEILDGKEVYGHPYEWELEKFQPTEEILEVVEPLVPATIEETPHIYVETEEQLKMMCEDLSEQNEIAIDLEHHSYRSFQGIVCLMQISTRANDYIVDTLRLRSELDVLNEVFTDPKIVKVLHGADMDIVWLQRDFGLYVVNMFDTGQAARVLNFAHFSLSYLLKHYCKVEANKTFQLADWRIRPLPAEMLRYAQEDTHYLLYIYDCMKNDLLQKGNEVRNLLLSAFQRSKVVCLKVYEKPEFNEDSYMELYKKSKKVFNARQLFALKELCAWRDAIARTEDESIGYVLPNHMLLQIAEILPREQQGIIACCNPVPPLVRAQIQDIHSIILKARESALSAFVENVVAPRPSEINVDVDLENILHCPHDTHHHEETLGLNTLFGENETVNYSENTITVKKRSLFNQKKTKVVKSKSCDDNRYQESIEAFKSYLSPFQRYKLVKQLNVAYKLGGGEDESVSETERIHKINEHFKRLAAVADPDAEDNDVRHVATPQKPAAGSAPTSTPVHRKQDVPLREKKKHKRKRSDIPLQMPADSTPSSNISETPPPKKSKTPENANHSREDVLRQSEHSKTTEGKSSKLPKKKIFNPDSDSDEYQAPSKLWSKKKKHSKQASFSSSSDKSHSERKNWPKR